MWFSNKVKRTALDFWNRSIKDGRYAFAVTNNWVEEKLPRQFVCIELGPSWGYSVSSISGKTILKGACFFCPPQSSFSNQDVLKRSKLSKQQMACLKSGSNFPAPACCLKDFLPRSLLIQLFILIEYLLFYPNVRGSKDGAESANCLETFEEREFVSPQSPGLSKHHYPTYWAHCWVLCHPGVLAKQEHCVTQLSAFINVHRLITPCSRMQGLQVGL